MIPSHRLKRLKRGLRRQVLARRDEMPPEARAERSARIADRLLGLPELVGARTVMVFWSFGSEVDTLPILERLTERGVRVALPRIRGGEITAVTFRPGDPVTQTAFGALEPSTGDELDGTEVDAVVTPAVAFDRHGFRVGYGGGFYDRFFRRTRHDAFRVAIGFELQVVPSVPHGHVDEPVDALVTEDQVIRTPRG